MIKSLTSSGSYKSFVKVDAEVSQDVWKATQGIAVVGVRFSTESSGEVVQHAADIVVTLAGSLTEKVSQSSEKSTWRVVVSSQKVLSLVQESANSRLLFLAKDLSGKGLDEGRQKGHIISAQNWGQVQGVREVKELMVRVAGSQVRRVATAHSQKGY